MTRGDWKGKPANIKVENNGAVCWNLPDRAQSFVFCSQIVTEQINAMFPLVGRLKMIGMLLNVAHGQVQKS